MKRRALFALLTLLLPVTLVACASGGSGSASATTDRDVLTELELEQYGDQDLYTVIRRIRSPWLNSRGTGISVIESTQGEAEVQVYIDGTRTADGFDALRNFRAREIKEARYMNSRDATMVYGSDHGAGAILVTTGGN